MGRLENDRRPDFQNIAVHTLRSQQNAVLARKIDDAFGFLGGGFQRLAVGNKLHPKCQPNTPYITDQIATQRALIIKRRRLYTPGRQPISVAGRLVIVVDDGLATGATMVAALHDTRERGPVELVCASPIASGQAYVRVSAYADSVICLDTPETFFGVGQFYREFPQVSDDEVVTLLAPPEPSRSSY